MALGAHQYYIEKNGKKIDTDGFPKEQPFQCVDLFKDFVKTEIGITLNSVCQSTGYARDIWYDFEKLGLNKYFDKVKNNRMVDGDWAIWDFSKPAPYSHVAMFRKDNENGTGIFLGQNQTPNIAISQINISYNGILGGLRPKIYHNEIQNKNEADQILYSGSKVKFNGIYNVEEINVKNNTAKVNINGVSCWVSSNDLDEINNN